MTCNEIWTESLLLQHAIRGNGGRHQRRLGVFRQFEVFFGSLEAQSGDRKPKRGIGFFKRLPCDWERFSQRSSHSGELGTLPGEKECSLTHEITILSVCPGQH